MHKHLIDEHVFQQCTPFYLCVLNTLVKTDLGIGLFDVGIADDCFTHHRGNPVDKLRLLRLHCHAEDHGCHDKGYCMSLHIFSLS